LALGYSPSYVGHLVRKRGTNFAPEAQFEQQVLDAGGAGNLVDALSALEGAADSTTDSAPEQPVDQLAACAALIHQEKADPTTPECRSAMEEDPASVWPMLLELRLMQSAYYSEEGGEPTVAPEHRDEFTALGERAAKLAPAGLAAGFLYDTQDYSRGQGGNAAITQMETRQVDSEDYRELRPYPWLHVQYWMFSIVLGWMNDPGDWAEEKPNPDAVTQDDLDRAKEIPDAALVHAELADKYFRGGLRQEAKAEARRAIALEPDVAANHLGLAYVLYATGEKEAALAEFQEAARVVPANSEANVMIAGELEFLGRPAEATAELKTALAVQPTDVACSEALVTLDLRHKDRKAAIDELERSLEASRANGDDDAKILRNREQDEVQLAALLAEEKRNDEAKAVFRAMLDVSPDDGFLHNGYGIVLMQMHQCKEASAEFQEALRTGPENRFAKSNFAFCQAQLGDSRNALTALKQLAEESHYDAVSSNALAWFYCTAEDPKFRNPAEALRLAAMAVQGTNGTDADILDTLAEAQLLNGKPQDALATEMKALKTEPENTQVQDRLSRFQKAAAEAPKH
jgi:Tfp pilus assembly protein PilF